MDHINRLFSGSSLEEIFQALESDGSDWSIKYLEVRNCDTTVSKISLWIFVAHQIQDVSVF